MATSVWSQMERNGGIQECFKHGIESSQRWIKHTSGVGVRWGEEGTQKGKASGSGKWVVCGAL